MPTELILSGVTFSNSFAKAMPAISGLLSLGFFGSSFDAINTNRAPGGPAFANINNPPVISASSMALPLNPPATVTATLTGGVVTALTLNTPGANYLVAPTVVFSSLAGGTGASATAVISGGVVTGFTNLVGGSGYTSVPGVSLSGGNGAAFDLGVLRSSVLAGGFSLAFAARVPVSGLSSLIFSDEITTNSGSKALNITMRNVESAHGNSPVLSMKYGQPEQSFIVLPSAATNWRFFALTYSGGAAGTFNLYSLSDNLSGVPWVGSSITAADSQKAHLGETPSLRNALNSADVAFAMVTSGEQSLSSLQAIYASVKSILAKRGVTVV